MAQIGVEPEVVEPESQPGTHRSAPAIAGRSPSQLFWSRFLRDKFAIAGLVFIVIITALALLAPVIAQHVAHHGPNEIFVFEMTTSAGIPKGPNTAFRFGADNAGRDLFVRVLYGARTSLFIAFVATGVEMVIGITLGIMAGFYRGKVDTVISRFSDIVLSLPILLLALGLVSACGLQKNGCLGGLIKPGLLLVSHVIALFSWPYLSRIVRGQVLSLREKEFVESAWAQGASNGRIMRREIFPNIVAPVLVYTTLIIPANILFEAALSYLGVGVPPSIPSWGRGALRRHHVLRGGVVDDALAGRLPARHHTGVQPRRGRAARCARSARGRDVVQAATPASAGGQGEEEGEEGPDTHADRWRAGRVTHAADG